MKKLMFAAVVCAAVSVFAAISEVTDVSQFATSYGQDRVYYKGPSATHAGNMTFGGTTLEITEPTTTLKLTGGLNKGSPALFVKNGPGTLIWSSTLSGVSFNGQNKYWGSKLNVGWNDDGSIRTDDGYGYCGFMIVEGDFVYDAPGKTLVGYDTTIGTSSCSVPPILIVSNGTFDAQNTLGTNWGRDTLPNEPAKIYIAKGGRLTTNNFWANWNHGEAKKTEVEIDGGAFIQGSKPQSVNGGSLKETARNGGVLAYDNARGAVFGGGNNPRWETTRFRIENGMQVFIENNSTFRATALSMEGGTLNVSDSTMKFDRYGWEAIRNNTQGGTVTVEGATLVPYSERIPAEWFLRPASFVVGANGLVITNGQPAAIDGKLTGSGAITKKGPGTLSMQGTPLTVNVQEGAVALAVPNSDSNGRNGTLTGNPGTKVYLPGANALGDMKVEANSQTVVLKPGERQTLATLNGDYNYAGAAQPRFDGWIRLNEPTLTGQTNMFGSVWMKSQVDANRSFTVDFDYMNFNTYPEQGGFRPYGFSVGFQNVGRGTANYTTNAFNRCLGWDPSWDKSFAFGFDAADGSLHYTVDGKYADDMNASYYNESDRQTGFNGTYDNPTHFRIEFSRGSHNIKLTMTRDGKAMSVQTVADLTNIINQTAANLLNFGFCGGGNSGTSDKLAGGHYISNVKFAYGPEDAPATEQNAGGTIEIAAGKTINVDFNANGSTVKDWKVGTIAYGEGSTVNVGGDAQTKFSADTFTGTGTLVKKGTGNLAFEGSAVKTVKKLNLDEGGIALGAYNTEYKDLCDKFAQTADNWNIVQYAYDYVQNAEYPWTTYVGNHKAEHLGRFIDNGFTIGRDKLMNPTVSKKDRYVGMINSKNRFPINRPFRISYNLRMNISTLSGLYGFYNLTFHNDARGANTRGTTFSTTTVASGGNGLGGSYGIEKSASVVWSLNGNDASKDYDNRVGIADGTKNQSQVTWTPTAPVRMGHSAGEVGVSDNGGNHTWMTNATVMLTYDPKVRKMHVHMEQIGNGELKKFDTDLSVNIAQMVGDTEAYIGFGCAHVTDWYGFGYTVRDLKIAYLDDDPYAILAENWWTNPWSAYLKGGVWYDANSNDPSTPKNVGATFNDAQQTFTVGRTNNKGAHFNDYATCKTRIPTDRSWRISFKDKFHCISVGFNQVYDGFIFHADPRGYAAYTANTNAAGTAIQNPITSIANKFGYLFKNELTAAPYVPISKCTLYTYKNDASTSLDLVPKGIDLVACEGITYFENTGTSQQPAKDTWYIHNHTSETNAEFSISYDYDKKQVTLFIDQAKGDEHHTYTQTTDVDLATLGGDAANGVYLTFFTANPANWYNCLQTVSDLKIDLGPTDAHFEELTLGEGEHAIVYPDLLTGETIKIAESLDAANGSILKLDGEEALFGEISCDGMFTVDGGVLDVPNADVLKDVSKLNLANGAKLHVPFGVTLKLSGLYKDGVRLGNGTYSSDVIEGGGTVEVAAPGLMLLLK